MLAYPALAQSNNERITNYARMPGYLRKPYLFFLRRSIIRTTFLTQASLATRRSESLASHEKGDLPWHVETSRSAPFGDPSKCLPYLAIGPTRFRNWEVAISVAAQRKRAPSSTATGGNHHARRLVRQGCRPPPPAGKRLLAGRFGYRRTNIAAFSTEGWPVAGGGSASVERGVTTVGKPAGQVQGLSGPSTLPALLRLLGVLSCCVLSVFWCA